MEGIVKKGELLCVLGRPGSGCSTLLKTISSTTHGFKVSKDTVISYGGLSPRDIRKHYRGDVVYNSESDIHLPHLTVYQTLVTVARLKVPSNRIKGIERDVYADHITDVAMATYGLSHTRDTKVGSELVRGVSGGERKRVSIAEVWICGSKFQCWDNSTKGLDAATALEFIRALKAQASIADRSSAVAIYQCSQDAYELFDKVCVLYEGYQIYFGPTEKAKAYFEKMGYVSPARASVADFVTGVTSPHERRMNQDMLNNGQSIPQTPIEMNEYWRNSFEYAELIHDIDQEFDDNTKNMNVDAIRASHVAQQTKGAISSSPYLVSYHLQVRYLLIRNFWRIRNNATFTIFQVAGNSGMAFILGSMFYKVMKVPDSSTFYFRGAAMFFAVLFNSFSSLLEIFSLYEARAITEKHKSYSLYHPSAEAFASTISEIPSKILTAIMFNIVYYFLVNFRRDGGVFFFYFLINIVAVFAMSHLFRCVGSLTKTLTEAMVPASILLLVMAMFTGFVLPFPKMLGWSKWMYWINPLSYLFESLLINEFHDRNFPCASYIPRGSAYDSITGTERVCDTVGSIPGEPYVQGDRFIRLSYGYKHEHKWRGFGVGMAYVVFFFFVYLVIVELNEGAKQKGEMLIFPQNVVRKMKKRGELGNNNPSPGSINSEENQSQGINGSSDNKGTAFQEKPVQFTDSTDIEKGVHGTAYQNDTDSRLLKDSSSLSDSPDEKLKSNDGDKVGLAKSEAIFHWRDLCYDIPVKGGTRRILNNVDGWVKPGTLTALMGASGAGKTTLLDCLAQRTTMGVITGNVFIDGKPRDESFPRSIGYCQQQDLHLKTATVRESLAFAAHLRQPSSVSKEEKDNYVEEIIKILEMEKYADAVVGVAGEGLNVEQRKRLTIGVELAAKPKLLVFLDEPTSGLDSQTAWSVCQLMRKLANHGQTILCTIHQPSALLIQEFDRLLFLQKGGQTVYFGDLGEGCKTMINYFEAHGSHKCPPDANPAEWMLEVVGAAPGSHANHDYYEVWRNSEEFKAVHEELQNMEQELSKKEQSDDPEVHKEFATSLPKQIYLVSYRLAQQYWRSPFYVWCKFILTIMNELIIGFTFFKADKTLQGLQNQMLAIFMFTVIYNPFIQQYLPVFVEQRDLYEARERPSRTFSWFAFIVAQILVEVPWNFVSGTIGFFIYYYAVGFYTNASYANQLHERGALFWLLATAFFVYVGSLGILVISFIQVAETAAELGNLILTMALSFCGVLVGPNQMPRFWIFMYRVSPLTYLIDALLSTGIANTYIQCADIEFVQFTPPSGMTCQQYLEPYLAAAKTGYLSDPNATDTCNFCKLSNTNDFLSSVNSNYNRRWRNYGIFICFIVFNYVAGIFLYWLARVPKKQGQIKKE